MINLNEVNKSINPLETGVKSNMDMQLTGKISRPAVVKDKVIYSSIKTDENSGATQIVLFRKSRPSILSDMLQTLAVGDEVTVVGRLEDNPYDKKKQMVIDNIVQSKSQVREEEVELPYEF